MTKAEQAKIFGNNLTYYIKQSGKDQQQIAFELDIPKTTFNSWCVGKIVPYWNTIQKLAEYFNVSASDLVEEQTSRSKDEKTVLGIMYDMNEAQIKKLISYAKYLLKEEDIDNKKED